MFGGCGLDPGIWSGLQHLDSEKLDTSMPAYLFLSPSAGVQPVKVEQGTFQIIPASITNQAGGPVYLNVSTNGHDGPFGSPPLLYGFAVPSQIGPTANPVTASFRVSAALNADLGERYITLTAYNTNVTVSTFVNVNVTRTTIPLILRTSAPFISAGFASSIGVGSFALYLTSLPKNSQKNQDRRRVATSTDSETKEDR